MAQDGKLTDIEEMHTENRVHFEISSDKPFGTPE
jgi:hypothetical protein